MTGSYSEFERWRALSRAKDTSKPVEGADFIWYRMTHLLKRMTFSQRSIINMAREVEQKQEEYATLPVQELKQLLAGSREAVRSNSMNKRTLIAALALIGTACQRTKNITPYRVQYAGVLAMQNNSLIEMATGEGKSLVAAMAGILCGWYGKGCHLITVNDYLAERDSLEMREFYEYCGCSVSFIGGDMKPEARREAYKADVTYCAEKEVVADYLRDALALRSERNLTRKIITAAKQAGGLEARLLQRGLFCVIVDEADSVLIDRAVTPLIISQEVGSRVSAQAYYECCRHVEDYQEGQDYRLESLHKAVTLLPPAREKYRNKTVGGVRGRILEDMIIQALQAKHFYRCGHDYILDADKVVLVDNSTGRLMPNHSWKGGMQQAVEAKEGVEITLPKETCARISFQRFFRQYERISGMTGTASECRQELWQVYRLPVVAIPPRKVCPRIFLPVKVLATKEEKWQAVLEEAVRIHAGGRPVLIGTRNVRDSQVLGELFGRNEIPCAILNAVNHREEADIVAEAGKEGAITIATNMAGRGTDIKLGKGVNDLGGLHVIATEIHTSGRIDRQLFGRCSRQGNNGSVSIIVSWEDEMITAFSPLLARLMRHLLGRVNKTGADNPRKGKMLRGKIASTCFRFAQYKAQRFFARQRLNSERYDYRSQESLSFGGEDIV